MLFGLHDGVEYHNTMANRYCTSHLNSLSYERYDINFNSAASDHMLQIRIVNCSCECHATPLITSHCIKKSYGRYLWVQRLNYVQLYVIAVLHVHLAMLTASQWNKNNERMILSFQAWFPESNSRVQTNLHSLSSWHPEEISHSSPVEES